MARQLSIHFLLWETSSHFSLEEPNVCSATSSFSSSETDQSQTNKKHKNKVYVMTTNNTATSRSYDKPAYCYVCSRPQKKLPVHILQHQWLATNKGPDKDKLWTNKKLWKSSSQLRSTQRGGDPSDYQPASHCQQRKVLYPQLTNAPTTSPRCFCR